MTQMYDYDAFGNERSTGADGWRFTGSYEFMTPRNMDITENSLPHVISYVPTSGDPHFTVRTLSIRETQTRLTLTITANESSRGQIFYRTTSTNFNEADSVRFNIRPGTHEYVVEIGSISADFLRIDIGVNGSAVTLRDIRFYIDIDDSLDINPFRYRGKYFDRETGNYYLQARYYSPNTGRFTQPDPFWNTGNMIFGSDPQDPLGLGRYTPDILAVIQSANLYVYCINNPVMFYDPSGEIIKLIPLAYKGVKALIAAMPSIIYAGHKTIQGIKNLWQMGHFARGNLIEKALGANLGNFPVIDKFVQVGNNFATSITSIKSIDTFARSYQKTNALYNRIINYGTQLVNFTSTSRNIAGNRIVVNVNNSTQRILELAIPANATQWQLSEINRAAADLAKKGIDVVIHFFR